MTSTLFTTTSLLVLVTTGACTALFAPGAPAGIGGATQMASPTPAGPSHAPTTAAQWAAAEADAARAASAAGATRLDPSIHIAETGFLAKHHLAVAAGHCYHVGVAWAFGGKLESSVSFDPGTNNNLAGGSHRFDAPGRTLDFCADHAGGVTLTFSSIGASGAFATNELLEYALVVGTATESASARVARRANEAKQAKQATEAQEASTRLAAKSDADHAARKCHECYMNYQMCGGGDCRRSFDLCAHDNSYTDLAEHPENKPCGTP